MKPAMTDPGASSAPISDRARRLAPVVWLVGKVQSGKTSIVRALSGASDTEIGAGYRACTKTARIFDFPPEAPIIRFLDTRGLGEVAYDPAADIACCEDRAHLILAVVKALDAEQSAVSRYGARRQGAASGVAGGCRPDKPARGISAGTRPRSALPLQRR